MPITRNEGESLKDWFSRIVETEMNAGKPQDQALAIAYRTTGTGRVGRKAQKMVRVRVIRKQGEAQRWITVRGRRVRLADRKGKTPDLQHKTYYVPENASPQLRASIRRKQAEEDARYDAVMAAFKPPQSRMTA